MIGFTINDGGFRRQFAEVLRRAERPTAVLAAVGRELGNALKEHFRRRDREGGNRLSSRREHFWLQVAQGVNAPFQSGYNAVSVRVSDPRIAQKVFGGRIVPRRAGSLTIPVSEEAYGRTAATFEKETGLRLFLLRTGKGRFGSAVLAARRGGGLEIEYVLSKGVNQAPDEEALPEEVGLRRRLIERGERVVERGI